MQLFEFTCGNFNIYTSATGIFPSQTVKVHESLEI